MNASLPWRPLGFALAALAVPACFSADDFSPCRTSQDCGPGGVCLEGRCASLNEGDLRRSDARDPKGGDGTPEIDHCDNDRIFLDQDDSPLFGQTIDCPNDTVTLRGFDVPDLDASRPTSLVIHARTIVVEGRVNADGSGFRGGGGGGGGAGGAGAPFARRGGAGGQSERGGEPGHPGEPNNGHEGGRGGPGGNGGGLFSALGGSGGDVEPASSGSDGYFVPPETNPGESLATLCDPAKAQPGTGGGGGGGGRGVDGTSCLAGGGGGGGGAGGPGGGLIHLLADEEIILRGPISARGVGAAGSRLASDGGAACGVGEESNVCLAACMDTDAVGGDGGRAGASPQVGAPGGDGGRVSSGAAGGGGSGGFVLLSAPKLTWEAGAKIDVSGSGSDNGGLVLLLGQSEGKRDGMVIGARYECPEMQFPAE